MKKIFWVILSITSINAYACDVCGCAGMSIGFGDLSFYNQHKIGIGYSLRQFNSVFTTKDYFSQIDINGTYVINDKWSVSALLPYLIAQRQGTEGMDELSGLGDATIRVNYNLFRFAKGKKSQKLNFNIGLNLPTGKFEDRDETLIPQNFQIGSASLDYLFESTYQIAYGNWVGILQARYLVNTLNTKAYKFGNQAGFQAIAAYKIPFKSMALVPLVNFSYEHFERDINSRSFYQFGTGGKSYGLLGGLQLKLKNWLWTVRAGTNLSQSGSADYVPGLQFYLTTNYLF